MAGLKIGQEDAAEVRSIINIEMGGLLIGDFLVLLRDDNGIHWEKVTHQNHHLGIQSGMYLGHGQMAVSTMEDYYRSILILYEA